MNRQRTCLVIVAIAVMVFSSALSFAAPLTSVEVTGDFKVSGAGSGVVFPDGTRQMSAAIGYARTVLVSPIEGGTIQQNGTALRTALDSIADASADKPYLLKIEPGIYDIGANTLQMKQYVDIEGSGENTTVIEGSLDSSTAGVVNGASFAEIRFLTIKSTGAGTNKIAMYNNAVSPRITNVTAIATGTNPATGLARAFQNGSSTPTMTNVSAEASGASSNTGIANYLSPSPGMTLTNVKVAVIITSGAYAYGIYNYGAGGTSLMVLTNVTSEVSGGSAYTAAVYNHTASAVITNLTATSTAASNGFAVFSEGGDTCAAPACVVRIHNSALKGSTGAFGSLHIDHGLTTKVANSQIDGAIIVGSPTRMTCVGAFDENYAACTSACTCP